MNTNNLKYKTHYKEVKDIIAKIRELFMHGKLDELEKTINEELKKYPDNICLKNYLMTVYFSKSNEDIYINKTLELVEELKKESAFYYDALQVQVLLFKRLERQDELIDEVRNLPDIYTSSNMLIPEVLKGEARIKAVQENVLTIFDWFYSILISTYKRKQSGCFDEAVLKVKELADIIFEDHDLGFYNTRLSYIYLIAASDQADVKNKEKTLRYLKECIKYTKAFDEFRFNTKKLKNTSFLIDRITDDISLCSFSSDKTKASEIKESLLSNNFDFLRNDEEYILLLKELEY